MNIEVVKQTLKSWIDEGYIEGELLVEPEWYVLWRTEEVEEFNKDYELAEYALGFITFGGNGGGELLVVNDLGEVFYIPAIGRACSVSHTPHTPTDRQDFRNSLCQHLID